MNRQKTLVLLSSLLIGGWLIGCETPPPDGQSSADGQAASLPPGAGMPAGNTAQNPAAGNPTPPTAGVPAAVGVGRKGDYGPGLITTPASAYWKTQEKIVFEIEIPKALQLYKALASDGKAPGSHEAFMKEIIEYNKIKLPELPAGQIYQYDPASEQLMVVPAESP